MDFFPLPENEDFIPECSERKERLASTPLQRMTGGFLNMGVNNGK